MFGIDGPHNEPFRATALLTHVHWDHVQGIPFFAPLLAEGSSVDLYGPVQDEGSLEDTIRAFLAPPYFPVGIDDLPGDVTFHECSNGTFELPGASVTSAWVPHVGPTLGYRIECEGVSVAYVSDHQQPGVSSSDIAPGVLDLCAGVDLLIHDAQYDDDEFARHPDWGHCTVDYAVEVAARAGVGTLVLFHHDPCHNDVRLDELHARARSVAAGRGLHDVVAAFEGLTVVLDPAAVTADATTTVVDRVQSAAA